MTIRPFTATLLTSVLLLAGAESAHAQEAESAKAQEAAQDPPTLPEVRQLVTFQELSAQRLFEQSLQGKRPVLNPTSERRERRSTIERTQRFDADGVLGQVPVAIANRAQVRQKIDGHAG